MDEVMQMEIDLLCAVIDALPCPSALINRSGSPVYVGIQPSPVDLSEADIVSQTEILSVISDGEPFLSRVRLSDSDASAWGFLELYPVRTEQTVIGALLMFRPEPSSAAKRADALPGTSTALSAVWERLHKLSPLSAPVLIEGEDGVGKSGFAEAMHESSQMKGKPFVRLSMHSEPEELYNAASSVCTLYAHRVDRWPGSLLKAFSNILGVHSDGGRIGDTCRVIASSGVDLGARTIDSGFPQSIYILLRVFRLYIPPLRERPEDILPAATAMLESEIASGSKHITGFSDAARQILSNLPLNGNLRELAGIVRDAAESCPGGTVLPSHLPPIIAETGDSLRRMRKAYAVEQIERLVDAYGDTVDGKRRAAKELGIGLSTLYRILAENQKSKSD